MLILHVEDSTILLKMSSSPYLHIFLSPGIESSENESAREVYTPIRSEEDSGDEDWEPEKGSSDVHLSVRAGNVKGPLLAPHLVNLGPRLLVHRREDCFYVLSL